METKKLTPEITAKEEKSMFYMSEILEEMFEYEAYEKTLSVETDKWYEKTLDCIEQIENGESIIDGKRAEVTLVLSLVNLIGSQAEEVEDKSKYELEALIELSFMTIKRMGELTYREILDIFPIRIVYEEDDNKYFGASDIPNNEAEVSEVWKSFGALGVLYLCNSGIHFSDEDGTVEKTDFDKKIGDKLTKYLASSYFPNLAYFYLTFNHAVYTLFDLKYVN